MKSVLSKGPILSVVAIAGAALMIATCFAWPGPDQVQNGSKMSSLNLKVAEAPLNRDQALKNSYAPVL